MNLVKELEQYNDQYLYFCEPIKNNIINDGNFIRILYSTNTVTFNGIYLLISFNDVIYEKYYNKYKCIFNVIQNKELIDKIKTIEDVILKKIHTVNKIPQYKIYEQLKNGYIKIFQNFQNIHNVHNVQGLKNKKNHTFILKISGIWETSVNYGLTYKFTKINNSFYPSAE
jgi:hypothetical protein